MSISYWIFIYLCKVALETSPYQKLELEALSEIPLSPFSWKSCQTLTVSCSKEIRRQKINPPLPVGLYINTWLMFYWFISGLGLTRETLYLPLLETLLLSFCKKSLYKKTFSAKNGPISQTCWAQCGHFTPRTKKRKVLIAVDLCEANLDTHHLWQWNAKKKWIERKMYYAQPNQTAVMFWHHLATSLKTSRPLPKTNFQWATSTSYIGLAKSLWRKSTNWWGGYCWWMMALKIFCTCWYSKYMCNIVSIMYIQIRISSQNIHAISISPPPFS